VVAGAGPGQTTACPWRIGTEGRPGIDGAAEERRPAAAFQDAETRRGDRPHRRQRGRAARQLSRHAAGPGDRAGRHPRSVARRAGPNW
jgi:hypothetical protein